MPDAAFSHIPFLRDFLFVRSQWDLNPNLPPSLGSVLSTYTRLLISATPILLMYGQRWISLYIVACSMKLYTHYSILMVGTVRFELTVFLMYTILSRVRVANFAMFRCLREINLLKLNSSENIIYRTKNNVALTNWATPRINGRGGMTRTYDTRHPKQMK